MYVCIYICIFTPTYTRSQKYAQVDTTVVLPEAIGVKSIGVSKASSQLLPRVPTGSAGRCCAITSARTVPTMQVLDQVTFFPYYDPMRPLLSLQTMKTAASTHTSCQWSRFGLFTTHGTMTFVTGIPQELGASLAALLLQLM